MTLVTLARMKSENFARTPSAVNALLCTLICAGWLLACNEAPKQKQPPGDLNASPRALAPPPDKTPEQLAQEGAKQWALKQLGECEASGEVNTCKKAGRILYNWETAPETVLDASKGLLAYRKACDLGDAESCFRSGRMLEQGFGVAKDGEAAMTQYKKGCALKDPASCKYQFDILLGLNANKISPEILSLAKQTCEYASLSKDLRPCFTVATPILLEASAPTDVVGFAAEQLKKLCASNDKVAADSCFTLSALYSGVHVNFKQTDKKKAAAYLDKACKLGSEQAADCLAPSRVRRVGFGLHRQFPRRHNP